MSDKMLSKLFFTLLPVQRQRKIRIKEFLECV